MKILVTGAEGFIGKNLIAELKNRQIGTIYAFDKENSLDDLNTFCKDAEFVFHLAGVNRPENQNEFMEGNFGFTSTLLDYLKKNANTCPIVLSSSSQASLDNPYGQSKKAGEDHLFAYGNQVNTSIMIYRFPNVFGKWSRPNYNSGIATFCHNIARDLPVTINDPSVQLNLVYIDDVVEELLSALQGQVNQCGLFCEVPTVFHATVGEIVATIKSFKDTRLNLTVPDMSDPLVKALYSTYLSFLPKDSFSYPLKMNCDNRGSFTEFLRLSNRGQVSINVSKPGITKGNHWHHTKNEKFIVVSGKGVIRFRKYGMDEVIEYFVNGDKLEVVDIPTGYTHNIENLGDLDLVTVMWANEAFNPQKPDTFFEQV